MVRPRVVLSKCLGEEACRYNGELIRDRFLEGLKNHVEIVPVCPEVEVGLGVPRDPIRLVTAPGESRPSLVQPSTGRDLTAPMTGFSKVFLHGLKDVDGFILKSASPTCAFRDARVYASPDPGPVTARGPGLFGAAVQEAFPEAAMEDEGRLRNLSLRHHFLTRLFARARFRAARREGTMKDLIEFQSRHKFLLMGYNQTRMRELGRIVANPKKLPPDQVFGAYSETLAQALSRVPRHNSAINVLMHALGYVSGSLGTDEKAFFLDQLRLYREGRIPLSTPASVVRSWLIREKVDYLLDQVFFEPFPLELMTLEDSGKGRHVL